MTAENKKIISILAIILIIVPAILFSRPKKAAAFPVVDIPHTAISAFNLIKSGITASANVVEKNLALKNFAKEVGKQLYQATARRLLAEMTTSTVNWINTGFHGQPLFLENPESFFRDIAKSEIKDFVDIIGYNNIYFPFGRQTALQTIDAYKRQFESNAQYSLSKVINDPGLLMGYRTDFNVGGWNGFIVNTQYPQNNSLGFQIMMNDELGRRLAGTTQNVAEKTQTALQQGLGFLSAIQNILSFANPYSFIAGKSRYKTHFQNNLLSRRA